MLEKGYNHYLSQKGDRMVAILSVKYFEEKELHNVSNVDKSGSTLGLY